MAIELNVKVIGADVLARKFQSASQRVSQVMREKIQIALYGLEGQIKDKLSGKVLHVRTGRYRSSITNRIEGTGTDIVGKIGTNVEYARIHEYGGIIRPKEKKFLHFVVDGHEIFVEAVKMPKRPIWEPTLKENREKIIALFRTAFAELLR